MMRTTGLALLLVFAWLTSALPSALAQTMNSTTGGVDSATSRNGYPAGGGTVSLPTVQNSSTSTTGTSTTAAGTTTTTTTTGTTTTTTGGAAGATSSGAASGGSTSGAGGTGGGTGRGSSAATTGTAASSRSSGTQSGSHWVLCPPSGGGLAPLFTGMDLSCAPD